MIRVSDLVLATLDRRRLNNQKLSYDAYMRQVLGLPTRRVEADWLAAGRPQLLLEGWIEVNTQRFYLSQAEANGAMVVAAARRRTKKTDKPVRVREVR